MKIISTFLFTGWIVASGALAIAADGKSDAPAAAAKSPAAREVVDRYIKEIGGKETILKHNSMKLKGKWEMAAMNQAGDFELLRTKPNRQVMRLKLGDQGQIVNGYDGKIGWTVNPFSGAMLLEGKQLDQTAEEAEFYNILHPEKDYKSMESIGTAQMDGKDCIEIKLVTKSGREIHEFYDRTSGLLAATRSNQESEQGSNPVTIVFSGYKKIGDLLQATRLQAQAPQFEMVLTVSSVDYDAVADSEFVMPDEVKALIKK